MYTKPIAPVPGKGISREDLARSFKEFEDLVALVPAVLAGEIIDNTDREIDEQMAKQNRVLLPKRVLKDIPKDAPASIRREIMKVAGKRFRDLPKPSKKDERERHTEGVDNLVRAITHGWVTAMYLFDSAPSREEAPPKTVRLDDRLLPIERNEEYFSMFKVASWIDAVLHGTITHVAASQHDKVVQLYEAFASNFKNKIDSYCNSGNELLFVDSSSVSLALSKDDSGYFLRVTHKP